VKRFVEKEWVIVLITAALILVVSALLHADEEGTFLIGVGILAIVICIWLGPERVRLWREEHGTSAAHRR